MTFINMIQSENKNNYNQIMLFTGIGGRRVRVGKTFAAIDIGSKIQRGGGIYARKLEQEDIIFLSGNLFDDIKKKAESESGSFITLIQDDAGLEAAAREAMSLPNIILSGVIQLSGFLKFNFFFTAPDKMMVDVNIRRLLNARVTMYDRGKGYIIRPWKEEGLSDVETPWELMERGLPHLSTQNPEDYLPPEFFTEYNEKKKKFTIGYIDKKTAEIHYKLERKLQRVRRYADKQRD